MGSADRSGGQEVNVVQQHPLVLCVGSAEALESLGSIYQVAVARDDGHACQILRSNGHKLAAIVIDVDRTRPLEEQLVPRLVRRNAPLPPNMQDIPSPEVPILLVSERALSATEARNGDRVLSKPVMLATFTLAISDWHLRA